MATLVLTAVGTAIGGPLGGLVGSFLGASIDRKIFGGGRGAASARASDLAVQSSAYGEPIPRIYGRMRVAGNVIWSPGIQEHVGHGSGKRASASTSYSYSCSFAVALSARGCAGVGRIWADGKLLRNADGSFNFPATMRLYRGAEDQQPDPLIVAAEGIDNAPAYRGLAYAVFEDLALADYANRIPNLTFELLADPADPGIATIVGDLFDAASVEPPEIDGVVETLPGFAARQLGSLRAQLEPLVALSDLAFSDFDGVLKVRAGAASPVQAVAQTDIGALPWGRDAAARQRETRRPIDTLPDAIAIGFYDPARDYQLGLQRATRRRPVLRIEQRDLAVAIDAARAKDSAARMLAVAVAARTTAELHLSWRHAGIATGTIVQVAGDALPWRVRSAGFETMVVQLALERLPLAVTGAANADAGRSVTASDQPNGPTVLHVLDLPPLGGALPTTPQLLLAANGPDAGWRRADVAYSIDNADSFTPLAVVASPTIMGNAVSVLGAGPADRWDQRNGIDVELINDRSWLESREPAAVLAGANLALIGDELIHFAVATPIGARRFRLSGLLRGRRATAAAMATHAVGERFILIEAERLVPFDPPIEALGRNVHLRASSFGSPATDVTLALRGRALQPLPPAHLAAQAPSDGDVLVQWIRRSRNGFGWPDGSDVPLAEEVEAYRVEVRVAGVLIRAATVSVPEWRYTAASRNADGAPITFAISVAQISAVAGIGATSQIAVQL